MIAAGLGAAAYISPVISIWQADYDFMTEQGARELARRIVAYWAASGCKVDVRVEKVESGRHETYKAVGLATGL